MSTTGKKFVVTLVALTVILGGGWWFLQMRPPLPTAPLIAPVPSPAQPAPSVVVPVDPSEPRPDPALIKELALSLRLLADSLAAGKDPRPALAMLELLELRVANSPAKIQLAALGQALSADRQRLAAASATDPAQMSSLLGQMRTEIDSLPNLFVPHSGAGGPPSAQSQESVGADTYWSRISAALLENLSSIVKVRRVEDRQASFRTPEQGRMLTEQLRFRLELAALALELRNGSALSRELVSAQAILAQGFDADHPAVISFRNNLTALQSASQAMALPIPEASLRAIEPLVAGGSR